MYITIIIIMIVIFVKIDNKKIKGKHNLLIFR